jgi:hypothetical protein
MAQSATHRSDIFIPRGESRVIAVRSVWMIGQDAIPSYDSSSSMRSRTPPIPT